MTVAARTILIIDDDGDVRGLLEALVGTRPGFRLVGSVATLAEGRLPLQAWTPDVVVIGAHREGFEPMAAVAYARLAAPEACVVLLADLADPITLLDALARGADTVLSSAAGWCELMPAIELLLAQVVPKRCPSAA